MNTKTIDSLNSILVRTYAALALTQIAHWNIEGKDFFELHKAFEAQYTDLFEAVDEIAERIRAIGGYAMVKPELLAYAINELEIPKFATDFAQTVKKTNLDLIELLTKGIESARAELDPATENMLIERLTAHQKSAWMLRAYTAE